MADLPDIARLLAQPEGQYHERKSLWEGAERRRPRNRRAVRDHIAACVAAFANAEGGVLVLGAEDDGTPSGHGYPAEAVDAMLAVPGERLNPPLGPGIRHALDGQELLVFVVEPAPQAVMVVGDGFPFRSGDQVTHMAESAINAIKQQGQVESAEARAAAGRGVADLDDGLVVRAAEAAGLGSVPTEQFLEERRLADRRGEAIVLRQAAVLLFARSPAVIDHPNASVRVFRVHGTERLVGTRHNVKELPRIEGSIVHVIERTRALLSSQIRQSERLHDLFFRETPEYPTFAWQEAIVNAVAHRDYSVQGRAIEVWLYEDRLEVVSPGSLPAEVSLDDLRARRRVHVSRNPRIARVLTELGIMREQGEGIPRMIEEMERSWLLPPEFAADAREFRVLLRNTPIFETIDPRWTEYVQSLPLSVRQKRILVAHPRGAFTNGDYQNLNRVDRDVAYQELRELVDRGLVSPPAGRGRGARYRVATLESDSTAGQPPSGHAEPPAGRALLAERLARRGRIRNEDVRAAFGCSRQQATDRLRALVSEGVLERHGSHRGTNYSEGPEFASWARGTAHGSSVRNGRHTDTSGEGQDVS